MSKIAEEKPGLSARFYKALGLDVFAVGAALAVGYFYREYLEGRASFTVFLLALLFFGVFSALETFLAKGFSRRFFTIILQSVALLAFFVGYGGRERTDYFLGTHPAVFVGGTLAFVFLFLGELLSRRELENSFDIHFFSIARAHLKKLATAIVLFVIAIYLPRVNEQTVVIPEPFFESVFLSTARVTERVYNELTITGSVRELAESFVRFQVESVPSFNSGFRELTTPEQEAFIAEKTVEALANLKKAGISVAPDDPARKIFYQVITQTIQRWQKSWGGWFIVLWAILLFFAVRGVGVIYYWIVAVFTFFIFHLLIATNLAYIAYEPRNQEIVEFT